MNYYRLAELLVMLLSGFAIGDAGWWWWLMLLIPCSVGFALFDTR